jgi:hypothetical protein
MISSKMAVTRMHFVSCHVTLRRIIYHTASHNHIPLPHARYYLNNIVSFHISSCGKCIHVITQSFKEGVLKIQDFLSFVSLMHLCQSG